MPLVTRCVFVWQLWKKHQQKRLFHSITLCGPNTMCQHSRDEIGKQGITAVPSKPLDVIPHVASALCTAYEQHATSRTVAAAIKSLFDECVGIRCVRGRRQDE